jgi:uncharacterized YigZ family protein
METDRYLTIKTPSEGIFKDRGSKFIAFAYPVTDEEEIRSVLTELRRKYHDARHHCFAWRLGTDMNRFRVNDDGEPSNSAGNPILGQIRSKSLTNILIVVVRYFGGTLLGVPGLINAYKTAAAEALKNTEITEQFDYMDFELSFQYPDMNMVMNVIKDMNLEQYNQEFGSECSITVRVRKSREENLRNSFRPDCSVKMKLIKSN